MCVLKGAAFVRAVLRVVVMNSDSEVRGTNDAAQVSKL